MHYIIFIDKVFPMDYKLVSAFFEGVTEVWQEIARELGLSEQTIHRIHQAHQGNSELCCQQMIKECLIGTEVKINWHSLTEALRRLKMELLADNIDLDWGKQLIIIACTQFNPCCKFFRASWKGASCVAR